MSEPARLSAGQKGAAAIAAVILVTAPFTAGFEGLRTSPYRDATGTKTVCYGETEIAMRVYSADECGIFLREALGRRYAPQLLKCVPGLLEPERLKQFSALLDFAYNAGWAAACRSPMAAAFNAGRWVQGCGAFLGYYVTSKKVWLKGLVLRREKETVWCLSGL